MNDSTLDLFCEHKDTVELDEAELFSMEIEMKAKSFEVTVDYYMMEFM
jgi:hypothetical protein